MLRIALETANGSNIEQVEIQLAAELPAGQIISAWQDTVSQTEALRTGFVFEDGQPIGMAPLAVAPALQEIAEIPACWEDWLAADRAQPLPLDGGPPWRAKLWPDARKLVWTFHHALLDGRSIAAILHAFQVRLAGDEPGPLSLAISEPPEPAEIAAAEEFHRQAFSELDAHSAEFPADEKSGPVRIHRSLGREMAENLEAAAAALEVTAPSLLTWAWGQAVATAAGAPAVVIGQVRAGARQDGCAGFTMTTVPLVISRAQAGPVAPVLQEFRRHLLDLRRVEKVPPEELSARIFQETGGPWPGGVVMVERGTLQHMTGGSGAIKAVNLHESSGESLLASAWIRPELRLEVESDGTLYGRQAAASLLDHWAAIATALAKQISTDAAELTALREEMRRESSESVSGPAEQRHLAQAWREAAEKFAGKPALWTPAGETSYAELSAQVEHLAARGAAAGVLAGQPVATLLCDRKYLAVVLLALARLGAINVPLDPGLPEKRLRAILADAGPETILTDQPDACAPFSLTCLQVDGGTGESCHAPLPDDPTATLSILYTSGSTGQPKGVMMVHRGVTNEAVGMAGLAEIGPGDRVLQFASPGFDASLEELLATLLSGATLVPRPEELASDLDIFHRFIGENGITVLDLSTAHWAAWCSWMISEKATVPANVRTIIIGGERAAAAAVQQWFASGGRKHLLINTYGPTEASIVGTAELIRGDWDEPGDPAIGRPLPGVHARVADAAGRPLPPGAAGELWLGGICVGAGYWKRQDLTALAFHDFDGRRWYRTGDRVFRDAAGDLRFLGRQDDQLKIRGNRIEPNEVIRVLESFPGVAAAHAGPVPGHGGSPLLAAWIRWEKSPADGWPGQLAAHSAIHLPAASVPTRWAAVATFQLTERGKLDRRALPEPALTSSAHASSDPPATATEKWLAEVWSALLGVAKIGRDESFFELGGHSLAALQVFARIARQWKIRIPMAMLMQSPTPRLLGAIIDGRRSADTSVPVVTPIRSEGGEPPLFCIHGGDGGVFFYQDLAHHLPAGRPLLAIEAPALAAEDKVLPVPVEETAASYVLALREVQPHGPFHLAGYSYGGLLVYEIARQLIAAGETVAFAGLFDTINPAAPMREYSLMERAEVFWDSQNQLSWIGRIGQLVTRTREGISTHLRVKKESHAARNAGATEPHSDIRMLQVREAHWESMMAYQPGPLACHITLFKSQATNDKFDIPDDYGWRPLVGSMDIVRVQGRHLTMFAPRHVGALAREISRHLGAFSCVLLAMRIDLADLPIY